MAALQNSRCTSLDQINSGTVDGIVTLKNASKCSIVITGGTETGHASGTYSHWNGYKLDISLNSCIDAYVKKSFAYQGLRSDGAPLYKSSAGNLYAKEGTCLARCGHRAHVRLDEHSRMRASLIQATTGIFSTTKRRASLSGAGGSGSA